MSVGGEEQTLDVDCGRPLINPIAWGKEGFGLFQCGQ